MTFKIVSIYLTITIALLATTTLTEEAKPACTANRCIECALASDNKTKYCKMCYGMELKLSDPKNIQTGYCSGSSEIDHCLLLTKDASTLKEKCSRCMDGYVSTGDSSSKCEKITEANCRTAIMEKTTQVCTTCMAGYVLDVSSKKCEKKENKIEHCKSANLHESKMHCLWCSVGFVAQLDGSCLRMTNPECR